MNRWIPKCILLASLMLVLSGTSEAVDEPKSSPENAVAAQFRAVALKEFDAAFELEGRLRKSYGRGQEVSSSEKYEMLDHTFWAVYNTVLWFETKEGYIPETLKELRIRRYLPDRLPGNPFQNFRETKILDKPKFAAGDIWYFPEPVPLRQLQEGSESKYAIQTFEIGIFGADETVAPENPPSNKWAVKLIPNGTYDVIGEATEETKNPAWEEEGEE